MTTSHSIDSSPFQEDFALSFQVDFGQGGVIARRLNHDDWSNFRLSEEDSDQVTRDLKFEADLFSPLSIFFGIFCEFPSSRETPFFFSEIGKEQQISKYIFEGFAVLFIEFTQVCIKEGYFVLFSGKDAPIASELNRENQKLKSMESVNQGQEVDMLVDNGRFLCASRSADRSFVIFLLN